MLTTSKCISPLMSIRSKLIHSQGKAGKVMSNCEAHAPLNTEHASHHKEQEE